MVSGCKGCVIISSIGFVCAKFAYLGHFCFFPFQSMHTDFIITIILGQGQGYEKLLKN